MSASDSDSSPTRTASSTLAVSPVTSTRYFARVHRPRIDDAQRGRLHHGVTGHDAGADRLELEEGHGGVAFQTMRRAPTTVTRRTREKVRGRVNPLPGRAGNRERRESLPTLAQAVGSWSCWPRRCCSSSPGPSW